MFSQIIYLDGISEVLMSLYETMKEGWYLIKTKVGQEKRAIYNLENQGFGLYCPMLRVGKTVDVGEILFPGYMFLHFGLNDIHQYHKISSTRGVNDFVRFNKVDRSLYADGRISINNSNLQYLLPQPIPQGDKIISQIKEIAKYLEEIDRNEEAIPFSKGDTVIICNPLYDHLKATFVKGISMNRGLVLIQYIRAQRNAAGDIEEIGAMSVKKLTLKLSDIQKANES